MSDTNEAPVVDVPAEAPKPAPVSPANDLRELQALLIQGIFPGAAAPAILKGFKLLDDMATKVENDAKTNKA